MAKQKERASTDSSSRVGKKNMQSKKEMRTQLQLFQLKTNSP